MQPQPLLELWFNERNTRQHFVKNVTLDDAMRSRFGSTLEAAARCELWHWRVTPEGRLAEIIVLDQFSRNIYRATPRAFAQDQFALVLAQELVASGQDATRTAIRFWGVLRVRKRSPFW